MQKTSLHQRPRSELSISDEWETPNELFLRLCNQYDLELILDVACTQQNKKTKLSLMDGLQEDWDLGDVWCNPPYSMKKEFIQKANEQYKKFNINIMMLIPLDTQKTKYWYEEIEKNRFSEYNKKGFIHVYPVCESVNFLVDGKSSKFNSRNGLCVVIWRKK